MNDALNLSFPLMAIDYVTRTSTFGLDVSINAESCSLLLSQCLVSGKQNEAKKKSLEAYYFADTAPKKKKENKSSAIKCTIFSFNAEVVCVPWCARPPPRGSPGASLLPRNQQREHRALVFVGFKPESGGLSLSVPILPPIKGF